MTKKQKIKSKSSKVKMQKMTLLQKYRKYHKNKQSVCEHPANRLIDMKTYILCSSCNKKEYYSE